MDRPPSDNWEYELPALPQQFRKIVVRFQNVRPATDSLTVDANDVDVFVSSNSQPSQVDLVRGHIKRA